MVYAAKKAEETSEKISLKLANIIRNSNTVLLIYCGATYGLAQHMLSILKISKPQLSLTAIDGDYAYNILLPYIAETIDLAIVFSDIVHEKTLTRLLQSIFLNNIKSTFIIPNILYEKHKMQWNRGFENINIIEIENNIYRLTLLLTAMKTGIYIGESITRINRMKNEIEIASIVEEIIHRYKYAIDALKTNKNVIVSKTMIPVGEYLEEHNYNVYIMNETPKYLLLSDLINTLNVLIVIHSSIEDHIVNEFIVDSVRKGLRKEQFINMRINTDPFTAPLYGILVSMITTLNN
uniref:SIS domain-containing protein n=1 Tax=Ignisphaera aggregans TaxID=334771 RepID=A0A7C5Z0D5_9CREN